MSLKFENSHRDDESRPVCIWTFTSRSSCENAAVPGHGSFDFYAAYTGSFILKRTVLLTVLYSMVYIIRYC